MSTKRSMKASRQNIKALFIQSRFTPLLGCFLLLGLAHVIVRMKNVEQDYALHDLKQQTIKQQKRVRQLTARQATLLSVQNLRRWSDEHGLMVPGPEKMLVIPKSK